LASDTLKSFIGRTVETSVFEVDREAVRRFADAAGDQNPLYWDEDYARQSRHGAIIAPPGFISALWFAGRSAKWGPAERPAELLGPPELMAALEAEGYTRMLDTGIDYEFHEAIKAGDTIRAASVVKDIMERGKETKAAFLILDTTYTNQEGVVVARARSTTAHQ
jgi:acyl dehydratase